MRDTAPKACETESNFQPIKGEEEKKENISEPWHEKQSASCTNSPHSTRMQPTLVDLTHYLDRYSKALAASKDSTNLLTLELVHH